MDTEGLIKKGQVSFLIYAAASGNIVFTFTYITLVSGRPFWFAVLLGVLSNIPLAYCILLIVMNQPGNSIFDILKKGMGKIVCSVIILIYLIFNIILTSSMLSMFTGIVKIYFLERTPTVVISIFLLAMCSIFANSSIQVTSRLIQTLSFFFTLNYFAGFSISFSRDFNISYVIPVFDTTYSAFFRGVLITSGMSAECLLYLMAITGLIQKPHKEFMSVFKGLLSWSIVLSAAIMIMEGVYRSELLSHVAGAGIAVSRTIQIGNFVRGLEILILMTYQYLVVLKIVIFLQSCFYAVNSLFKIKMRKLFFTFFSLLVLIFSMWMNSFNLGYFISIIVSYFLMPFVIVVLVLSSISVRSLKKRSGSSDK